MRYQGREIDPIELWSNYVEFPPNVKIDGEFLPKVQCPNPEHDTLKRHFQINAEKGLVHCFAGCGISGTYSHAISIIEGISERAARKVILRHSKMARSNVHAKRDGHKRGNSSEGDAPARPEKDLHFSRYIPAAGLEYLKRRGISERSVAQFQIGWDKEDLRVVIPAKDLNGTVRFLIKRATRPKDQPKYLYTEGFPKTSLLFGACDLDPGMVESLGIVVVEGSIDRIVLWQNGIQNVVATLGTGLSEIQAKIIERLRPPMLYMFVDRDTSGIRGLEIARKRIRKIPIKVCRYPSGKYDPAELTGREAHRAIARAVSVSKVLSPNAKVGGNFG